MTCHPNCTFDNAPFNADPDIAGEGVVIAFLATAWFTFTVAVASYLTRDCIPPDGLNGVDRLFLPLRDRLANILPSPRLLQNVLLMLGDLQLITGTSVYLVAYIKHCTISQYHFNIAVLQAQSALDTYSSIALATRDILRASRFKRFWRWPWIIVLCTANIVSSFIIWDNGFLVNLNWGLPMQCAWETIGNYNGASFLVLALDILQSLSDMLYTTTLFFPSFGSLNVMAGLEYGLLNYPIYLFKGACRLDQMRTAMQNAPLRAATAPLTKLLVFFMGTIFLVLFCVTEIVISTNFQLLLSYLALVTNSSLLVAIRQNAAANGMQGDENSWGFGQLLPLLLLAIPLFESVETLLERNEEEDSKSSTEEDNAASERRPSGTSSRELAGNEGQSIHLQSLGSPSLQPLTQDAQDTSSALDGSAPVPPRSEPEIANRTSDDLEEPDSKPPRRVDTEMNRAIPAGNAKQSRPRRVIQGFFNFFYSACTGSPDELRNYIYKDNKLLSTMSVGIVYTVILVWYHWELGTGMITGAAINNPHDPSSQ